MTALQWLRSVAGRRLRPRRNLLRIGGSGSSFSSPSGSHCCGQLRTTFRCEVEFSLHLLGDPRFFHGGWLYSRSSRLICTLSRGHGFCCLKLSFQPGELLRTFLHPSFEALDPFLEIFSLFHIGSGVITPTANRNDGVDFEVITKPHRCHVFPGYYSSTEKLREGDTMSDSGCKYQQ